MRWTEEYFFGCWNKVNGMVAICHATRKLLKAWLKLAHLSKQICQELYTVLRFTLLYDVACQKLYKVLSPANLPKIVKVNVTFLFVIRLIPLKKIEFSSGSSFDPKSIWSSFRYCMLWFLVSWSDAFQFCYAMLMDKGLVTTSKVQEAPCNWAKTRGIFKSNFTNYSFFFSKK